MKTLTAGLAEVWMDTGPHCGWLIHQLARFFLRLAMNAALSLERVQFFWTIIDSNTWTNYFMKRIDRSSSKADSGSHRLLRKIR